MRLISFLLAAGLALLFAAPARAAEGAEQCPFLAQYAAAIDAAASLPDDSAAKQLFEYAADPANENPAACEAIALEAEIARRERSLAALRMGSDAVPPDAIFHCYRVSSPQKHCDGLIEDGTGQPVGALVGSPATPSARSQATIEARASGMRLISLYRATIEDVQAGRAPQRLPIRKPFALPAAKGRTVIFAFFAAPAPYRYRKFVWYP